MAETDIPLIGFTDDCPTCQRRVVVYAYHRPDGSVHYVCEHGHAQVKTDWGVARLLGPGEPFTFTGHWKP